MSDKSVYDVDNQELHYVAPHDPPPSRKPPVFTVGVLGWLRKNLFSSWVNSLLTIFTLGFVALFLYSAFSWALLSAEWNVVTGNLRLLMVGQYSINQLWRVELMAMFLILICGISLGIWSNNSRPFFVTVIITLLVIVLVPIGATRMPEAPIRFIVEPDSPANPVFFVANAGQEIGIAVEPISQEEATSPTVQRPGFLENTPGLSNSRNVWSNIRSSANAGLIDLEDYDLAMTIRLVDGSGAVLQEVTSTPENPEVAFSLEVPRDDWYYVEVEHEAEVSDGYAWVRLDGIPPMSTQLDEVRARQERYGARPGYDCPGAGECRVSLVRGNLRFEGTRNLGQFFSVQLTPFFNSIMLPVLAGVLIASGGIGAGQIARRQPVNTQKVVTRMVVLAWLLMFPVSWVVLRGVAGSSPLAEALPMVPTSVWGGLMLTLVLAFVSIAASFPIGILLALGRTSNLPAISLVCTAFIELVRGVPLITILFFAKLIVPYFAAAITDMDMVIRMMIGLTLFTAAYQAEVIRGGLQIVPSGQTEAAYALGLSPVLTMIFITLPQALRAVIPAIMSQFVSLFKDTTLVSIVGLFELLGMIDFIVSGQQANRTFQREAYLFVGIVYFVIASGMSTVSRRLEETGSGALRRRG
jgi:His/Glu/Gln/Arg/opine family amino acid ABC transporter permease subunit